jgi:signal peptidase I
VWFLALGLVVAGYAAVNALGRFLPDSISYYVFSAVVWSLVTASVIFLNKRQNKDGLFSFRASRKLVLNGLLLAILQLMALVATGFVMGFGSSPFSFAPSFILINTAFFGTAIIAFEFSRAYLIRACSRKRLILGLVLISFLFTLVSYNWAAYAIALDPLKFIEFVGGKIIPTFAINLVATYLVLLGGPTTSLAYMFPLQAFTWLSPVQPNPDWTIRSLVNVIIPTIGFLFIGEVAGSFRMIRVGAMSRSDLFRKGFKIKKSSSSWSWFVVAVVILMIIWIPTGYLGIKPSVLVSGSMSPALNVGDIVVTTSVDGSQIAPGDIIQYMRTGSSILITHRVLEVEQLGADYKVTTKGDASNTVDQPILVTGKIGKVLFTVPRLGWVTIVLRGGAADFAGFVGSNIVFAMSIIMALVGVAAYAFYNMHGKRRFLK